MLPATPRVARPQRRHRHLPGTAPAGHHDPLPIAERPLDVRDAPLVPLISDRGAATGHAARIRTRTFARHGARPTHFRLVLRRSDVRRVAGTAKGHESGNIFGTRFVRSAIFVLAERANGTRTDEYPVALLSRLFPAGRAVAFANGDADVRDGGAARRTLRESEQAVPE